VIHIANLIISDKWVSQKPSTAYSLPFDILAPTTKAVGSEYVTENRTDGFSRRTTKNMANF